MRINVHAGHNPDGKKGSGAVGLVKESTEARKIKNEVISQLRALGHTVYDCTCENGKSSTDVLQKIVKMSNAHEVDLEVSIHLNAGRNDAKGDGSTGGVEVLIYNADSKAKPYAENVCNAIFRLGYRNRGVKIRPDLYVLKKTKAPAMLIECFFCDDRDDVKMYVPSRIAGAIVTGITGGKSAPVPAEPKEVYGVVTGTGVNVRAGAGTGYAIIGKTKKGQKVRIWRESNGWYMVDTGKWISTRYVRKL